MGAYQFNRGLHLESEPICLAIRAWRIVKHTVVILMEGTPKSIEIQKVYGTIRTVESVQDVHDLHVWTIARGKNALSCKIVLDGHLTVQENQKVLREIEHRFLHQSIGHVTIQVEDAEHPSDDSILC